LDGISAFDRRVIELLDDDVAGAPGERLDGVALPLVAVLVEPDFGRRARPEIGDRKSPKERWRKWLAGLGLRQPSLRIIE